MVQVEEDKVKEKKIEDTEGGERWVGEKEVEDLKKIDKMKSWRSVSFEKEKGMGERKVERKMKKIVRIFRRTKEIMEWGDVVERRVDKRVEEWD